MNDSVNRITLAGRLVCPLVCDHSVMGEAFYKAYAASARLSGTVDVLPVTIPERLLGPSAFPEEGDMVVITGSVRAYNHRSEDGSHLLITVFAGSLSLGDVSMQDVNEVELCGRICKPVIYRRTPFLREIADMILCVDRGCSKTDRLPVIAWGRNARFASGLPVGTRVFVRGRLQSRLYNKLLPDGTAEERTAYEVSCSTIEVLD